jgi:2-oxoglutarate ferredoxin oxidoreductase subunit beta
MVTDPSLAYLLSRLEQPQFPEPVGVLRCVDAPRYEEVLNEQIAKARKSRGEGDLQSLFNAGETWMVN